ncbi:3-methyladenine DNA glycosylase 2 [Grimontia kaedaensis]|uniref:DNA-3-methyladenine glycosylase II n=1 Tax=Grimontia kaedaensis TaxID=2872157 RepID=A0ABY4WY46_9GAMM|nr:3-methyladenine DNA glycosylase 2 [Grimontia kaedaensis]USH03908.1 3-methyladenine DNA glycosylase 2 [Grimontia kaedaensis]
MSHAPLSVTTPLPESFRHQDFLTFHRRDKTELAEKVDCSEVIKGITLQGVPTLLHLTLSDKTARLSIHSDAEECRMTEEELQYLLKHMLGLRQTTDEFEFEYRAHPELSRLLNHSAGLRIPQTVTPFEAITWAITGQLISVEAAVSIRRRLIEATGVQHSSGMWCLPDEKILARTEIETYRSCGYSNSKATTIQRIAQALVDGSLSLSLDADPKEIGEQLLAIKGVGPWTVSYTLLRGFGWLDGSLHGDVAVRRSLQQLLGLEEKPTEKETKQWLASFSPYRALVAAHLWAMDSDKSY